MLIIDSRCELRLAEARALADRLGVREQLEQKLAYLENYACHGDPDATHCHLFPDFAPYSFDFTITRRQTNGTYDAWFNGGLIFHGHHDGGGDGGAPTFSVSLAGCPEPRWEIHT